MVLTQDSSFRFQVSGIRFQGLGRFVVVGVNRVRPIFVFAIFILDSADARFRFQVSGVGQVCCWGESHSPCFCIRDIYPR